MFLSFDMDALPTVSTIIVVILWALALFEKGVKFFTQPNKKQDAQIIKINSDVSTLNSWLEENKRKVIELSNDVAEVKWTLTKIKDNHLAHLQADVNLLKESNAATRTDLEWIKNKLDE